MKITFALVALAAIVGAAAAARLPRDVDTAWAEWKAKYEPGYLGAPEHDTRKEIFARNWAKVHELNAAHVASGGDEVFGYTPFLDIDAEEFRATYTNPAIATMPLPELPVMQHGPEPPKVRGALASDLDWRQKGVVSPVKNQGQCGSCWAFSAVESIESANALSGKSLEELSPQQVVDCSVQDSGCRGGLPYRAISYVQQAGGLELETSYPYTSGTSGSAGRCKFEKKQVALTTTGFQYATQSGSEGQMVSAINSNGPLSIAVDASQWQFYSGGVLKTCGSQLDHAVQAVGYANVTAEMVRATWAAATDSGADPYERGLLFDDTPSSDADGYWIVRNSWSEDWGEDGYIFLKYGKDACGLTQMALYATA